jgi:hypothetical protein
MSVNPLATRKYNPARVRPLRKVKMNCVKDTPPHGYSALYLPLYTSGEAGAKSMDFAKNFECYPIVTYLNLQKRVPSKTQSRAYFPSDGRGGLLWIS